METVKKINRRLWPRHDLQVSKDEAMTMVELVGVNAPKASLHSADRKGHARAGWAGLVNLSHKGMGLRLLRKGDLAELEKDTALMMVYNLPGNSYSIRSIGKVRWSQKKQDGTTEFGIRFQALTIKDRYQIESYLQARLYKD